MTEVISVMPLWCPRCITIHPIVAEGALGCASKQYESVYIHIIYAPTLNKILYDCSRAILLRTIFIVV